jgi:hypothetical protein
MRIKAFSCRVAVLALVVSSAVAMGQSHRASQTPMLLASSLPDASLAGMFSSDINKPEAAAAASSKALLEPALEGMEGSGAGSGSGSGVGLVNATGFGGADIGAKVNAAIASLPTVTQNSQTWTQGVVLIPAGNYTFSTTMNLNSPYLDLHCEQGAILTYTGSGDAIRILPSVQISGAATTQPNQGPSVENCSIYNQSSTAVSGIHAGDISKIHLTNVAVNNFTGTATSAAYWFDNTVSFTEGMALQDITSTNNSIAIRFTNTAGTSFSDSFGYSSIRGFRAEVRTNQIGFSVENNTFLYHSFIDAIVEPVDSTGIVMSVSGTGKVGGNAGDDTIFLRGECVNASGSCTGATLLKLGATTQFVANGFMNGLGTTMTINVASGAVLTWNGTTELNQSGYNIGWSADNSIRMRFNSATDLSFFGNNVRLAGNYVVGWSTQPTTAGNYLGLSPCVVGTAMLCLGNGTTGNAGSGLNTGQVLASQFLGNSATPLVAAGAGLGGSPSGVALSSTSTSVSGVVTFTTGTGPAALSPLATVTFATLLGQASNTCIPTAQNAATATALSNIFISSPTTAGFVISSGAGALVPSTSYQIGYACF